MARERQVKYEATPQGKATLKRYSDSTHGREAIRRSQKQWKLDNPEKHLAHRAVHRAVKRGDLIRPTVCEHCGREGFCEASHTDYTRQLDVEWLCRRCHIRKDRG